MKFSTKRSTLLILAPVPDLPVVAKPMGSTNLEPQPAPCARKNTRVRAGRLCEITAWQLWPQHFAAARGQGGGRTNMRSRWDRTFVRLPVGPQRPDGAAETKCFHHPDGCPEKYVFEAYSLQKKSMNDPSKRPQTEFLCKPI
jgi:hypothetical protein